MTTENIPQRKIRHLVVSGGAVWGFTGFGILFQAIECGFLNMEDVQSIYATSVGSIITSMLALKINHNILFDYLLKRPWENVCKQNKHSLLEIFDSKGIIHKGFIENMFLPLLKTVDLSPDISLLEFYNITHIDLHIYTTELNQFKSVDLSHETHPTWKLLDAIYASCTVPLFFSPIIIENECYIDGCIFLNYPLSKCIEKVENIDEIFGISLGNHKIDDETIKYTDITISSNIFEFITTVLNKMLHKKEVLHYNNTTIDISYQIHCLQNTTMEYCMNALYNREYRHSLLNEGVDKMKDSCKLWFTHC
jgi:predicted acylesterase/phospholipase RssA